MAGRSLHHGRILVYVVDLVCESRRCDCAIDDQQLFRDSPHGPSGLHRGRTLRRDRRLDADELVAARRRRGRYNGKGGSTVSVTIYHNPACGTSRNTLAMIRQSGEQPEVIEYLKNPPDRGRAALPAAGKRCWICSTIRRGRSSKRTASCYPHEIGGGLVVVSRQRVRAKPCHARA